MIAEKLWPSGCIFSKREVEHRNRSEIVPCHGAVSFPSNQDKQVLPAMELKTDSYPNGRSSCSAKTTPQMTQSGAGHAFLSSLEDALHQQLCQGIQVAQFVPATHKPLPEGMSFFCAETIPDLILSTTLGNSLIMGLHYQYLRNLAYLPKVAKSGALPTRSTSPAGYSGAQQMPSPDDTSSWTKSGTCPLPRWWRQHTPQA